VRSAPLVFLRRSLLATSSKSFVILSSSAFSPSLSVTGVFSVLSRCVSLLSKSIASAFALLRGPVVGILVAGALR